MGKYINRLYCMMAATMTSYIVNMMYQINNAFAVTCPQERVCGTQGISWNCQVVNGEATATMITHGGGTEIVQLGADGENCNYASAGAAMSGSRPFAGYSVSSCKSDDGGDYSGRSGRVECFYTSCGSVAGTPTTKNVSCGVVTMCGAITMTASCINNAPGSAGFLINGGKDCACCPSHSRTSEFWPTNGTASVLAIYNAEAATSCYIVGDFQDYSGLFEYTDSNRCYYAS